MNANEPPALGLAAAAETFEEAGVGPAPEMKTRSAGTVSGGEAVMMELLVGMEVH